MLLLIIVVIARLPSLFTKCQLETAFRILEWAFLASSGCIALISLLAFLYHVTSVVSSRWRRRWSPLGRVTAWAILWKDDEFASATTFISLISYYAALVNGLRLSRGEALPALALLSYRWRCSSSFLQILVSVHWLILLTVCIHWRLRSIEATGASLLKLASTFDSNLVDVRRSAQTWPLLSH